MPEIRSVEMGVRELRANLSETINNAVRGQITYITVHGRRIAGIVPVTEAEAIEAAKAQTTD